MIGHKSLHPSSSDLDPRSLEDGEVVAAVLAGINCSEFNRKLGVKVTLGFAAFVQGTSKRLFPGCMK